MREEKMIWEAIIFGTILLVALGGVLISFLLLYQRKKYRHREEVIQIQETFAREMVQSRSEIQEQTLQHVATEIHDNLSPTLGIINFNLAGVVPRVNDPVKEIIVESKDLVKQVIAEMKSLSVILNTDKVSKLGFTQTLEIYLEHLRKNGYYTITLTKEGDAFKLLGNKETILFRMCQESLNNVIKHANAKNIHIRISYGPERYTVEINDDGIGFDPSAIEADPQKMTSSGLRNLRNRALAIDAELTIKSKPNIGTTIIISLAL